MINNEDVQKFDLTGNRYFLFEVFVLLLVLGIFFEKIDREVIPIYTRRWEMYGLTGKQALDMYSIACFCFSLFPFAALIFPKTFDRKVLFVGRDIILVDPLLAGRKRTSVNIKDIYKIRFFRDNLAGQNCWWAAPLERSIGFSTAPKNFRCGNFTLVIIRALMRFRRNCVDVARMQ